MPITSDDLLLRGMAWLSLLAWSAGEWLRADRKGLRGGGARTLFSGGLVAMVCHSLLAFHLRYGFRHDAALADAARQIEAVTGRASADGFFLNYVFIAWWALEALAWWTFPERYRRRPAVLAWASRLFFAFMFVNGAIVFARGPVRVFGAAAVLAAGAAWTQAIAIRNPHAGQRDGA